MRIMPSGNGSRDWIPKSQIKTASTNGEAEAKEVETDSLLEAAQKVVANMAGSDCCGGDDFEGGDAPAFETNDNEFADDGVEFEGEVSEVADEAPATGEEAAIEALEVAKDAIGDAVEALGGESDEVEMEIEVDDDEFGESTVEVEDDLAEDDIVAEGNTEEKCCPTCKKPGPCKCDTEDCCSSDEDTAVQASSDDWVRTSAISPKNRKQVYDYWSKQLGYPKDFVKLMVKDYE
jgi:hypothetical protein